jgi:hypothetical protein
VVVAVVAAAAVAAVAAAVVVSMYKDVEFDVIRMWKVRDKIVSVIIGALRTIKKGLDRTFRSPVGPRATEGHTNEHCSRHLYSAGVNRFGLLLRDLDLLEDRHLITNRRE